MSNPIVVVQVGKFGKVHVQCTKPNEVVTVVVDKNDRVLDIHHDEDTYHYGHWDNTSLGEAVGEALAKALPRVYVHEEKKGYEEIGGHTIEQTNETSGTCLLGYVTATYDLLVDMFGKPEGAIDDSKQQCEWALKIDGVVVTIYDWKRFDMRPEDITNWHIGGFDKKAVKKLRDVLKAYDPNMSRWVSVNEAF